MFDLKNRKKGEGYYKSSILWRIQTTWRGAHTYKQPRPAVKPGVWQRARPYLCMCLCLCLRLCLCELRECGGALDVGGGFSLVRTPWQAKVYARALVFFTVHTVAHLHQDRPHIIRYRVFDLPAQLFGIRNSSLHRHCFLFPCFRGHALWHVSVSWHWVQVWHVCIMCSPDQTWRRRAMAKEEQHGVVQQNDSFSSPFSFNLSL